MISPAKKVIRSNDGLPGHVAFAVAPAIMQGSCFDLNVDLSRTGSTSSNNAGCYWVDVARSLPTSRILVILFLSSGDGALRGRHFFHFRRRLLQVVKVILRVLFGTQTSARVRMARDHAVPVERDHLLYQFLILSRRNIVRHVTKCHGFDRNEIDHEDQFLFRQPHDQRTIEIVAGRRR